jgi:hypothetical protein
MAGEVSVEPDEQNSWKRALPDAHHVALCDLYHLKKFLAAGNGRREQYLSLATRLQATLEQAPCGVSDRLLLKAMALALGDDRTFLSYVLGHGGTDEARDPERWQRVLEAGAGAILGEYFAREGAPR